MDHMFILGLIGVAVVLFALELLRPDIVAIGIAVVLMLAGTVTVEEGLSGFSNPAVLTVVAMFILSSGLIRTGVADYVAETVHRIGGGHPLSLIAMIMLAVGLLSAFMNNIGAVAVLLPSIFVLAQRANYPASKLLMPLSFGALLGGLVTLIGTPPNLLVSIALEERGFRGFKMFDFAPTGVAVLAVGIIYMMTIGRHLIPSRDQEGDAARHFSLEDYLIEVVIPQGSPLAGKKVAESRFREDLGLNLLRRLRQEQDRTHATLVGPEMVLAEGDRLLAEGKVGELLKVKQSGLLEIAAEHKFTESELADQQAELAEVVIAPNSLLLGRTIKQIDVRRRFGVLVLALKRRGRIMRTAIANVPLRPSDVLLVQGTPKSIVEMSRNSAFLVVNRLEHEPRHLRKAPLAVAIMVLTVGGAAAGVMHISVAGLLGVLLMALTGCVNVQQMYQAVEWRVVFLIACMMPLGTAMDTNHTGTAQWLSTHLLALTGTENPRVVLASLFLFTTLITEVMSNAAAAVLLAPIGIAIAVGMGLEPHPFLMGIAIAASTTFLTPIGHQANILIYGVGNYRFSDFPRAGALLNLLVFAVSMVLLPIVWPFTPLTSP
jgi:di/tricarboxylate transporter